ncbi:MAG: hypothetical protein WBG00_04660 [Thermoanaerobaculia bacterium]
MKEKKSIWTNVGRILAAGLLVAATLVTGACDLANSPTEPEAPAAAGPNAVILQGGTSPSVSIATAESTCILFDGNGDFFLADDVQIVATGNKRGSTKLKCQTKVAPNDKGKAVSFDFDNTNKTICTVNGSPTEDWHETVSSSGKATLTCFLDH